MKSFAILLSVIAVVAAMTCSGCKREERGFRVSPPQAGVLDVVNVSELHPGGSKTNAPVKNDYEDNAQAISDGKQLYEKMNCVGCHAHGGGGMGPPLIDDKWIYGSNPEQIYATIMEGRPNGMPSWSGKIPNHQVWQIVAYVRSLGGLTSKDAVNGRADHMRGKKPENSIAKQKPHNSGVPPSAEMPL